MTEFCINCRREQEVIIRKEKREMEDVCGKPRDFSFTVFRCKECGGEMSPPGSMDLRVAEYDQQFKEVLGL